MIERQQKRIKLGVKVTHLAVRKFELIASWAAASRSCPGLCPVCPVSFSQYVPRGNLVVISSPSVLHSLGAFSSEWLSSLVCVDYRPPQKVAFWTLEAWVDLLGRIVDYARHVFMISELEGSLNRLRREADGWQHGWRHKKKTVRSRDDLSARLRSCFASELLAQDQAQDS